MRINVKQLFDGIGEKKAFTFQLDLSSYELFGRKLFSQPLNITGNLENRAGIVSLTYLAAFTITTQCDRCLDDISQFCQVPFEHVLVRQLQGPDNDDYIIAESDELDLDPIVYNDVLLQLPSKFLCKPDCKGMCPVCGANWNKENCACSQKQVDPRLEVLKDLLH